MTQTPSHLDYGPPLSILQRSRTRRGIVVAFVFAFVLTSWLWLPSIYHLMRMSYYQRQCARHLLPRDQIVFEPDASDANLLLKRDDYGRTANGRIAYAPPALEGLIGTRQESVFLHQRTTPAGRRCLVSVSMREPANGTPSLVAHLFHPVQWGLRAPNFLASMAALPPGPSHPMFDCPRIFAGQPDPLDQSHFTIAYEYSDRSGVIDGWVRDGDIVIMEPRN